MSQKDEIVEKVMALAEPLVAMEGLELVDVEWVREGQWVLRLAIDKAGGAGGIGLDECQSISRAVEAALDVEDFIKPQYALEVSSPGLNRPLTKPEHFLRFAGSDVKVKTFGPIGEPPRKNFVGKLTGFEDGHLTVEVPGAGPFRIPLKDVAKANLEYDFSQDLKKKK